MTRAAIISGLVRWAKRVGRWLLRRLARRGAVKLIASLEIKIDELEERRDVARGRKVYRARRWHRKLTWRRQLLAWLRRNGRGITKAVVKAGDQAIDALAKKVPLYTREAA